MARKRNKGRKRKHHAASLIFNLKISGAVGGLLALLVVSVIVIPTVTPTPAVPAVVAGLAPLLTTNTQVH